MVKTKSCIIALGVFLFTASSSFILTNCARFRSLTPQQKIELVLTATDWGIRADHDFGVNWVSDAEVEKWHKLEVVIRDVVDSNPATPYAAAIVAIKSWEMQFLDSTSRLPPYLDALVLMLRNQ